MPFLGLAPRLSIHYEDHNPQGSPAVLLLHGLGVTGSSWQLQIPCLVAAGFRVIAPDARGFGQSTYPGGGISIAGLADDIAALLEATGVSPAHVVGISMGGTLALQLALDRPELVRRLVLVNTFARLRPRKPGVWLYLALRLVLVHTLGLEPQARAVARRIFPSPAQEQLRRTMIAQIMQADPRGYRASMRALARFDVQKRLGEIHIPTLVVTADGDTTILPENQRPLAEMIPGARQVIIPGARHAVIVDQPEAFNRELLNFLTQG
jgi:3-oxoadipate enol-lactonase